MPETHKLPMLCPFFIRREAGEGVMAETHKLPMLCPFFIRREAGEA